MCIFILTLISLVWAEATLSAVLFAIPSATPSATLSLTPSAPEHLERARIAAAAALSEYAPPYHPDQPLWGEAISEANAALRLEPNSVETLRFLGESYTLLGWHIRAWSTWLAYLEAGGSLDWAAQEALSKAGMALGYARYAIGELTEALEYFHGVNLILPGAPEVLLWLGELYLELRDPAAALPYFEEALESGYSSERARYLFEQTQRQLAIGIAASDAFEAALARYEAGAYDAALSGFLEVSRLAPAFGEAYAWAGRVSLELDLAQESRAYWQRVLALDPQDEGARYFLMLAEERIRYGSPAAIAFREGFMHHGAGRLEAALESFRRAIVSNPDFTEAFAWLARTQSELGDAPAAALSWGEVLRLNPDDVRARHFLEDAPDETPSEPGSLLWPVPFALSPEHAAWASYRAYAPPLRAGLAGGD